MRELHDNLIVSAAVITGSLGLPVVESSYTDYTPYYLILLLACTTLNKPTVTKYYYNIVKSLPIDCYPKVTYSIQLLWMDLEDITTISVINSTKRQHESTDCQYNQSISNYFTFPSIAFRPNNVLIYYIIKNWNCVYQINNLCEKSSINVCKLVINFYC